MTSPSRAALRQSTAPLESALDAALADVFDQHADFVWRVLKRLGTPAAELEDALQEVFLVVARKLPSYEERGELRAWLFSIARQVASHARRAQLRRQRRESDAPSAGRMIDPW